MNEPLVVMRRAVETHHALAEADIRSAIGGALSLGYHVNDARSTQDVDLNITLPKESAEQALHALPREVPWGAREVEAIRRDGQVRIMWPVDTGPPMPLDLFFAEHAFHHVVADRTITVPMLDTQVQIISATDLVVFKVLFDRRKDWADIEEIVRCAPPSFDLAEAIRWLIEIVGPKDTRIGQLRSLTAEFD